MDERAVDVCFDAHGDHAEDDETNDHCPLNHISYEADTEAANGGVDRRGSTLDDDWGKTIKASEGVDN